MRICSPVIAFFLTATFVLAQRPSTQPVALTIYNKNFAVARTSIDLDLRPGMNEITTTGVTSRLEPDSVVLRDPAGKRIVHVLEQNYDAAVVSQGWLLQKYEGKTISFQISTPQGFQTVQGTIIRAPFQRQGEYDLNGQDTGGQSGEPLIEVNGKMQIQSEKSEHFSAELAYITAGLDWEATYNIVVPNSVDITGVEKADVLGWVTIHNQSGMDFPQARIKLMAGDVAKLRPEFRAELAGEEEAISAGTISYRMQTTQKPFDDFHLYDLNRTVALRDGETKQVQFIDAADVTVRRNYLYDGTSTQLQPYNENRGINNQRSYGLGGDNTKVHLAEEIQNTDSNHLGMPLPAGRVRLYRRDADGQMEFVGEDAIKHTPAEAIIKLATGSAFDVGGARRQTDFHVNEDGHTLDESFEIKITNQKQQPVTVTIVEHLYRGLNWEITEKSSEFTKLDSRTVEFPVQVPSKGESTLNYSVRYTW